MGYLLLASAAATVLAVGATVAARRFGVGAAWLARLDDRLHETWSRARGAWNRSPAVAEEPRESLGASRDEHPSGPSGGGPARDDSPEPRSTQAPPATAPPSEAPTAAAEPAEVEPATPQAAASPSSVGPALGPAEPSAPPAAALASVAEPAARPPEPSTPAAEALAFAEPATAAPEASDTGAQPDPAGAEASAESAEALMERARSAPPAVAERLYRRALEIDPQNHHAMNGLARLLLARNAPAQALPLVEEAIRRRPRRASYRVLLGDVRRALGDAAGARRAYEQALELDPAERAARERLGP